MTINDLSQLEELLKLCHRQGVHAMKIDGIEFALNPLQEIKKSAEPTSTANALDALYDMTDEELYNEVIKNRR